MRRLFSILILQFLLFQTVVWGQIFFSTTLQEDGKTYVVKLRPDTSYESPLNTTNNAQLTFVVPTGGFSVGNINNIKGTWVNDNNVIAPMENPNFDYLVFNLSGNISDIEYIAGEEVDLFSFENTGACTGALQFITTDDPFFFNSQNINIGNQISVLGAGLINAYSGSFGEPANCQQAEDEEQGCIVVDSIVTTNPTLCGEVGGTITIFASVDNGLPLQYSINDGDTFQPEPVFRDLESGKRYAIRIRDEVPICDIDYGIVELGPPADAVILSTTSTPDNCGQSDGTVTVRAVPVVASTTLEYSIDQGQTWLENDGFFTGLVQGTYQPRVRAKDAPCHDDAQEVVVAVNCTDDEDNTPAPGMDNDGTADDDNCVYTYMLEAENGIFTISLLPDTTVTSPLNTTVTAQVTLKVPTGGFLVDNFQNLLDGVLFQENGRSTAPSEAPEFDYIVFGLTTLGTRNIPFEKGVKVPLFSFENSGTSTGKQVFLIENFTDPFYPPNSEDDNVGQQITVALTGSDLTIICVDHEQIIDNGETLSVSTNEFTKDTLFVTIPIEETTTICLEEALEIDNTELGMASMCSQGNTVTTTVTNNSNCIDITTDDHFNQVEEICVIHFDETGTNSDTTIIIICPAVSLGDDLEICAGTTLQLSPIGGTGDFEWITDDSISCTTCTQPEITPTQDARYILVSVDGDNCIDTDTLQITILEKPAELNVTTIQPTDCEDNGSINISVGLGQPPYKYSIDGGQSFQDSAQFNELPIGNYQIVVANEDESCTTTYQDEVNLTSDEVPLIEDLIIIAPNECISELGSITINASIGTNDTLEYSIDNGTSWQLDTFFSDLIAGNYAVLVRIKDSDCQTAFQNNPIELVTKTGIEITQSPGDRTICSDDNRSFVLEGSENIDSFEISGAAYDTAIVDGTRLSFMANPAEDSVVYSITLIGESGCTATETLTVRRASENVDEWEIDIETTPASCEEDDGTLNITINGNNDGFSFQWGDGESSASRTGLHTDSTYNLTITSAQGCSVTRENLSVGTDCDIPSCNIFSGLDTLVANVENNMATVCLPIADMDISELEFYEDGQLISPQIGECMQSSVFYDYSTIISLGEAPYLLIEWSLNGDTLRDFRFNTIEELVLRMNQFDPQANWVLNESLEIIQGFATSNDYGVMKVRPEDTFQILELQVTFMNTMFQSIILDNFNGIKKYTIKDDMNDCEDELYIRVEGLIPLPDTIELVTQVNTSIVDQCLSTAETGTDSLEIRVCEAPLNGTLSLGGIDANCFVYIPNTDYVGNDSLCLELCNGIICDTTYVNIIVNEEGLLIHTGFSPNEDGVNDKFTIRNIESYPENSLIIYNRWGNLIFKKESYTNSEAWDGSFDGKILPDGIYFYLLNVRVGDENQTFSGSLTLSR